MYLYIYVKCACSWYQSWDCPLGYQDQDLMVKNGSLNITCTRNFKYLDVRNNVKLGQIESQNAFIYTYIVLEWEKNTIPI